MFNRIWRAFTNKTDLYPELKAGVPAWEAWAIVLVAFAIGAVVSVVTVSLLEGVLQFFLSLVGYLFMAFWAWLIGAVIGKGNGSFGDVQKAIAYPYAVPAILTAFPNRWVGLIVGLWLLVILSTAIRETLGIGKGLTFFIVISSIVVVFGLLVVVSPIIAVALAM
ncbi:MAG: hypothetical protein Fur0043_24020 [Anaerolineales bacterium]